MRSERQTFHPRSALADLAARHMTGEPQPQPAGCNYLATDHETNGAHLARVRRTFFAPPPATDHSAPKGDPLVVGR